MHNDPKKLKMRGRVGSKGELFIPKTVRGILNLNPGDEVEYIAEWDRLIVCRVPRLIDVMRSNNIELIIDLEEFEELSKKILG